MSIAKRPRVLCLGYPTWIDPAVLENMRAFFDLHIFDAKSRTEWLAGLPKTIEDDGPFCALVIRLGTQPFEPFDEEFLKPMLPHLKLVTSASAGYSEFDTQWLTSQGVYFCNTVDAVSESTADMAIFLILATLRSTRQAQDSLRKGTWRGGLAPCRDPTGLKLGIVGMGAIGKHIARKAAVFNMSIQYHNRRPLPAADEAAYDVTYCPTLDSLLDTSDVVSLNVPLTAATTQLIGSRELARMKKTSVLINTARGAVVDEPALIEALETNKIWGAGLDVFTNEPDIDPYWMKTDKAFVQPHLGGLTETSFSRAEKECFENVKAWVLTGKPVAPVNNV